MTFPGMSQWGHGTLGSVTISSNTTLASNVYYQDLTIDPSVTVTTGGFIIYVRGTLTLNGTIARNGGTSTSNLGATYTGTGGGGGLGSVGAGAPGTSQTSSFGGAGGAAGAGSAGGGGTAGSVTRPATNSGGTGCFHAAPGSFTPSILSAATRITGGGGGGGGGGSGVNEGGIGGQGAGIIMVFARFLAGTGTGLISAIGGNGATGTSLGCGGGGGGGGGCVCLVSESDLTSLPFTISVAGGSGGAAGGVGGSAGSSGNTGLTYLIRSAGT